MSVSLEGTKNLQLVCPRCKEEKEDEDCLYNIYVEVKGVEGSSHEGYVLENSHYTVCGILFKMKYNDVSQENLRNDK